MAIKALFISLTTAFLAVGCVAFPDNGPYYSGGYDRSDRNYDRDYNRNIERSRYERERAQRAHQMRLEHDRRQREYQVRTQREQADRRNQTKREQERRKQFEQRKRENDRKRQHDNNGWKNKPSNRPNFNNNRKSWEQSGEKRQDHRFRNDRGFKKD